MIMVFACHNQNSFIIYSLSRTTDCANLLWTYTFHIFYLVPFRFITVTDKNDMKITSLILAVRQSQKLAIKANHLFYAKQTS